MIATAAQNTANGAGTGYALVAVLLLLLIACGVILMRIQQNARRMQRQHDRLMRKLISRRNELEAALSSMVEGVLAVDLEQRVMSMNEAAGRLLRIRPDRAVGRAVSDVIHNESLLRFIERTLSTGQPIQDDIALPAVKHGPTSGDERLYQAQGAELRDTEGERIGSLIVLHDVTRLRRLEVVRQDFVTNASHEIKTPVTAIRAAAETLLDTAEDQRPAGPAADANHGDPTRQFVQIIVRQADRLQAIVEDLLSLARLEQEAAGERVALHREPLAPVLRAAVETCAARAEERHTRLETHCDDDLSAPIHAPLLEQALVNLLDNAIKYGREGACVRLSAERLGREVVLAVQDEGVGIATEHLPRIFERFYRTDKARSRALGGTGLGLSIVKHIALAHGGRVSVDSEVGNGSTFRIHLPTS